MKIAIQIIYLVEYVAPFSKIRKLEAFGSLQLIISSDPMHI